MKWLNRLKLVFTYGEELDQVLIEKRRLKEEQIREEQKYHLNLCKKHQQESNHSHFSENNCHFCQLLKTLK
jgi:hypothetical protein